MSSSFPDRSLRGFRHIAVLLTTTLMTFLVLSRPKESEPPNSETVSIGTITAVANKTNATAETAADPHVDLVFAGDIMLADDPGEMIANGLDPFADFAPILRAADATVGNLECVVATRGQPVEKRYTFRADPRVLPVLRRHFRYVSLANNHTGDYGPEAFLEQLELLQQQDIGFFGGGSDCAKARLPLILDLKGLRIALLGYDDFLPRSFEAGPNWPGVAWCVDEQIVADLKAARAIHKADLVIPFVHWGDEYEPPNARQKALARLMIDHGADVVVGAHPHITQGVEYYKGKPIVYSLGNFLFDGFDDGRTSIGWLLRLRFSREGLVAWDTVVSKMDEHGVPHVLRDVRSPSGTGGNTRIIERRALIDSPIR